MENDQGSGLTWLMPFAYFDRDTSSWRTSQHSLLEESGESCTTWPKQGMWDLGSAYELPTSALLTAVTGSSSSRDLPTPTSRDWKGRNQRDDDSCLQGAVDRLLPTPDSGVFNDSQTVEAYRARKERELQKGYNGNGGGTTLAMIVRLLFEGVDPDAWKTQLLPTPSANDSTGAEKETREQRQEDGSTGGPSLRDLPKLLPTPMTDPAAGNGHARTLATEAKLLPTPVANPENPGTGGELRAAITHGEGRRNETGIDTMGRPNEGRPSRLLPTPMANQGRAAKDWDPDGYSASARSLPTVAKAAGENRLLPTPTSASADGSHKTRGGDRSDELLLAGVAEAASAGKLLPTPTAQAAKHGSTEDLTANGHGFNLWDVPHQLPTGESTETPSEDGSNSPGQHPNQLTIADA